MNNFIKRIDRYIIKKFLKTFFGAISLIAVIIIVFDVSEKLSDFIEKEAPLRAIVFDYYANFLPYFITDYISLFTFIAVIFFTSKMASNTEIIAILSSGISFKRMLRPFLIGAILIASLNFALSNYIIPHVNKNRIAFENKYIRFRPKIRSNNLHLQIGKNTQVYMENFDQNDDRGTNFNCEKLTDAGITEKIFVRQILFDTISNTWKGQQYIKRTINGLNETLEKGDTITIAENFTPDDMEYTFREKGVETMNLHQLNAFIEQEEEKGSPLVVAYKVAQYQSLFNPLSVIIMTLIGVSVSFRKKRGGMGINLAFGIIIAFSFVVAMKFSTVFSLKGNLPPMLSILIPLVLYAFMAYYLIKKAPK